MGLTYDQFVAKWDGKKADWDGYYAGQCVDLFRYYCDEVLEIRQPDGVFGAANFWYDFYTDPVLVKNFERIPNTPDFLPLKGDVGVWDWGISGGWGHIGMANGDSNLNTFRSFDQNWRTLSVCEMILHSYKQFLGVLRPKEGGDGGMVEVPNDQFEELVRKSTEYDKFVAAGYVTVEDVNRKVEALENDLKNCRKSNEELQKQIDDHRCPQLPDLELPDGWEADGMAITLTDGNKKVTTNYRKT